MSRRRSISDDDDDDDNNNDDSSVVDITRVIRIEREDVICPSLPATKNVLTTDCTNETNVNSECDFECEKGFYNVGSKKQECKMGYDSPGSGIYYGVASDWVPQLGPKCQGEGGLGEVKMVVPQLID